MFSIEIQEKLKNLGKESVELTITGINDINQPFETAGKIAIDGKGSIIVKDNYVYLNFGETKTDERLNYTRFMAPFYTDLIDEKENEFEECYLLIDQIKVGDEVLWTNENFAEIKAAAELKQARLNKRLEDKGSNIEEYDAVSEHLTTMIGQPIILKGKGLEERVWGKYIAH